MSKLVQPLKWHGGKHYLAPRIISLMPPHVHYVEPFFGGGSVLLQKPYQGISEVANDMHGELANFWRVLQKPELFKRFQREVEAIPFSQPHWHEAREAVEQADEDSDPVDRAVSFFVYCRQSHAGGMTGFATLSRNRTRRDMNEQVSSWLTAVEGLPAVAKRLRRVVILNQDACRVVRSQDGPKTLFYLDPPYMHQTRVSTSAYDHEMSGEQHEALLEVIVGCRGKVILSGYPNPLYDRRLAAWRVVDIQIDNKMSGTKSKPRMTERLWLNF
jgi:DNA adenine methylase